LSETKITLDDMIEWVKKDPEKVRRIMRAEEFVGKHGKIELYYHDGKCGPPRAQPSHIVT